MKAKHFTLFELVCPHVLAKYKDQSWQFIDSRLILNLDTIRERLNKPIYVNRAGLTQRGLRCPQCQIVRDKFEAGVLYMSAHTMGKAVDFDVDGMEAEEVRNWLAGHGSYLPYPIRVENDVNWVHIDVFPNNDNVKVYFFNA